MNKARKNSNFKNLLIIEYKIRGIILNIFCKKLTLSPI